jgi:hypothetical protein
MAHKCIFIIESSWKGKLLTYDFIERIVDVSEKSSFNESEEVDEYWDKVTPNLVIEFRKTPFEQIKTFLYPRRKGVFEDNGIIFPALITSNAHPMDSLTLF